MRAFPRPPPCRGQNVFMSPPVRAASLSLGIAKVVIIFVSANFFGRNFRRYLQLLRWLRCYNAEFRRVVALSAKICFITSFRPSVFLWVSVVRPARLWFIAGAVAPVGRFCRKPSGVSVWVLPLLCPAVKLRAVLLSICPANFAVFPNKPF